MASWLFSWSHHQWPGWVASSRALSIIALISASVMRPPSLGTSVTVAPKACIVRRFSSLNASEKTTWSLYSRAAHTKAREIPVVPAVYSTTVSPGRRRPLAAAAWTAARAMRSFMLPVGLAHSSLTRTRADPGGTTRRSDTKGVLPMPPRAPAGTVIASSLLARRGQCRAPAPANSAYGVRDPLSPPWTTDLVASASDGPGRGSPTARPDVRSGDRLEAILAPVRRPGSIRPYGPGIGSTGRDVRVPRVVGDGSRRGRDRRRMADAERGRRTEPRVSGRGANGHPVEQRQRAVARGMDAVLGGLPRLGRAPHGREDAQGSRPVDCDDGCVARQVPDRGRRSAWPRVVHAGCSRLQSDACLPP